MALLSISFQRFNLRLKEATFALDPLLVTTATDIVDPNDGLTSLREAITYANNHPGDDTITFDSSLAGHTITLTGGELKLTDTTGVTTIASRSPRSDGDLKKYSTAAKLCGSR